MSDMTTRDRPPGAAMDRETRERSAFNFEGSRPEDSGESIPRLVQRLAEQGSHLAEQQTKLAAAEFRSGIEDIKQSAGAMAGAAVLGLTGLGVVLMGVSFLLAEAMPLWLATLIVGLAALGGAYAMYVAGQKKLQSSSLEIERTRRTLERAPSAISGNTNEDRRHAR